MSVGDGDVADPAAATTAGRTGRPGRRRDRLARRRWAGPGVLAASAALIFCACLLQSRTQPVNSDGASIALQAWAMLHGNPLLHGWTLSDVSFYTTELPQYMLLELAFGLSPEVIHIAAAMTYTLLVVLAALLARGHAQGREAVVRMVVAAGIMIVPALGTASNVLLLSPDHTGTTVPLLLAWLVIDRARPRWFVPVIVGTLLALTQVADQVALAAGAAPLALVCAVRCGQRVVRRRQRLASAWYELALAAAAVISAVAARLALRVIARGGGFVLHSAHSGLAQPGQIPGHAWLAAKGVALLFGADFSGQPGGAYAAVAAVHLAGLALVVWAVCVAVRRLAAEPDLVPPILVTAIALLLGVYVFTRLSRVFLDVRDISAVLPMGAALAGRMLAGPLLAGRPVIRRLLPVLLAAAVGYAAVLGYNVTRPPAVAGAQQLAAWLAARHLRYGLGAYWQASSVTLASAERIAVRPVRVSGGREKGYLWEAERSWYNPRDHYASYLIYGPRESGYVTMPSVLATFGRPARTYHVGPDTVLAWNENLLTDIHGWAR